MNTLRSAFATFVALTLVGVTPGIECYQAAAQVHTGRAGAPVTPGAGVAGVTALTPTAGVAPLSAPALQTGLPATRLSAGLPSATPASAPAVAAPALPAASAAVEAPIPLSRPDPFLAEGSVGQKLADAARAAAAQPRVSGASSLDLLAVELPDFEAMSDAGAKGAAQADFAGRVGMAELAVGEASVSAAVVGMADLKAGKTGLRAARRGGMPDRPNTDDPDGVGEEPEGPLDPLGNPSRRGNEEPDGVPDEFPSRRGGGFLAVAGLGLQGAALAGMAVVSPVMLAVYLGVVIPSLILHEMGHAKAADMLGDSKPRVDGRMRFRPADLWNHVNMPLTFDFFGRPIRIPLGMTFVLPLITTFATGYTFGAARPVQTNPANHRPEKLVSNMAKIALAGPAVNFGLALLGGLAHAAAIALGMTGLVPAALAALVFINVALGLFNLLPFAPLDGHHIVRWLLFDVVGRVFPVAKDVAVTLDRAHAVQFLVALGLVLFASAPLIWAISTLTGFFLAGSALVGSMQLASGALPALAAVGLMIGQVSGKDAEGPEILKPGPVQTRTAVDGTEPGPVSEPMAEPVDIVVQLTGAPRALARDVHLSLVGRQVNAYLLAQQGMVSELEQAGLSGALLQDHGATPIATYRRINAATLRVPADRLASLKGTLEAKGFRVFSNDRRKIIEPVPSDPNHPESPTPDSRGAVTMPETLGISNAAGVHKIARERWGPPLLGFGLTARATVGLLRLLGADIPQPPVAVIDTGVDTTHKQLRNVTAKNATSGSNEDDNGHGSWVTGMVLWYAPWLKSVTHYKTFVNGGATLDDILRALTMAGNDGNIIMSNSWGSDDGDPDSPDSQLVGKLAEEGRVMVFAAGNSGSSKNTIGSPAIMVFRDPKTGAKRVISVAATDRNKKAVYFSSRGKGSWVTSRDPRYKDWPQRPDAGEEGYNTESSWPANLRPDRTDPTLGPLKALNGTSMSTPKLAGAIALLAMLFGVTSVGDKLDAVVNALLETLVPVPGQGPDDIGGGFVDVGAAYEKLAAQFTPVAPSPLIRLALPLLVGALNMGLAPGGSAWSLPKVFLLGGLAAALGALGAFIVGAASAWVIGGAAFFGLLSLAAGLVLGLQDVGTGRVTPWYQDAAAAAFSLLGSGLLGASLTSMVLGILA